MDQTEDLPFRFAAGADGPGRYHVVAVDGRERLSRDYRFDVVLACRGFEPDPDELLGVDARLTIATGQDTARHVHGLLSRVTALGAPKGVHLLEVSLVPRAWLLRRRRDSRVFQQRTVPEIVAEVFGAAGVAHRFQLDRACAPRGYCVQYQETDHAFVARLLAEEGIFSWFEQPPPAEADGPCAPSDREVMVLADAAAYYPPIAGEGTLHRRASGALDGADHVEEFRRARRVRTGRTRVLGYDYERPRFEPASDAEVESKALGVALESYEHARVLEDKTVGAHVAALRLEERRVRGALATGASNCRRLAAGHRFELVDHTSSGRVDALAVTEVRHRGRQVSAEAGVESDRETGTYRNEFVCLPADVACRPRLVARRPRQVMETATVVGPAGEEIHTDELGRIKVQFHWDRFGARDEHSSCWVRPAQAWAGAGWGAQFVPRVGSEVLVGFVGGDPDRPVVLGSLYNGAHAPPFNLPEEKTSSGLRTRSTPGGDGYNELVFEDAKGAERIYVHAERDLDALVEHDRSATVRGDDATLVEGDRLAQVGGSNTRLVAGDEVVLVSGNLVVDVAGNQVLRVGGGVARSPRVEEAAKRVTAATSQLREAAPARTELAGETAARRDERDAGMLAAVEALSGDDARAARILVRQVVEGRDAERALSDAIGAALETLDRVQEGLLTGALGALPAAFAQEARDLAARAEALRAELVGRVQENAAVVAALAAVQDLARADLEDTLRAVEGAKETLELLLGFVESYDEVAGGSVTGGGAAPPGYAKAKVQFAKFAESASATPSAKEVEGSMLDVKDAVEIRAGSGIKLTCGASTIELTPGAITLSAPKIAIDASGTCDVHGNPINLN